MSNDWNTYEDYQEDYKDYCDRHNLDTWDMGSLSMFSQENLNHTHLNSTAAQIEDDLINKFEIREYINEKQMIYNQPE